MGLFSSIGGAIAKGLDYLTVGFVHPIKTAEAILSPKTTVAGVIQEHFAQPLGKQIPETVLAGVGYAGAVLGGAAVGAAAKAGTLAPKALSAAQALIPATTKGKIIAAG